MPTNSRILLLTDHFLPGFKAGGVLRSVANFVEDVGGEYDIWIMTRDRDLGDRHRYPHTSKRKWSRHRSAHVAYLDGGSPRDLAWAVSEARRIRPDLVYLNSYMSTLTSILPLCVRRISGTRTRFLLAPRGELSDHALSMKPTRKRLYRAFAARTRLHDGVMFHTSTEVDAADVARYHPSSRILISPDTVRIPGGPNLAVPQRPVKLVHISRISPIKNLHRVIQALAHVETRVQLDVWGPIEDPAYWKLCNQATAELPVTAEVRYRGQIHSSEVHDMLGRYHALVCCSLSENFGQNVAEALAAGCPVIVSNTLHWATVVDGTAGWTVDPVNLQDLAAVLKMVTMAPDDEWRRLRIGCSTALGLSQEIGARMSGRQLIEAALSS